MRSSDGNSNTEDTSEDHSTDLLSNFKDNFYSLVTRRNSNRIKNGFNLSLMGQKDRCNDRFNSTNYSEIRCHSLPDCVEKLDKITQCDKGKECNKNCDEALQNSSASESWFKTWPERCDKQRSTETSPIHSPVTTPTKTQDTQSKINCDNLKKNNRNKISLNDALRNISLAYSPVTKQLHLIEKSNILCEDFQTLELKEEIKSSIQEHFGEIAVCNEPCNKKLGHRRTEAGSFSSTISTLSEPSSNGSLLSTDDRSLSSLEIPNSKVRKKSFTNFFSK